MAQEDIGNIRQILVEDEMRSSYLDYAMSVITARALPDVRDGLKPAQRRILVAMNDLNLAPNRGYRKCAKIAGDTSGNYHPHGEAVVYPTLVRMAQPFNMRYPLVDGQGNFGSVDGDPPAAMRYTEARLTPLAMEMLADIDMDTVDMVPNYDGTRDEPVVLPGRFPNLVCNGSAGIAVGMATNMPPHNLGEVVDALHYLIENPEAGIDDLLRFIKGPDFPTGGLVMGFEKDREGLVINNIKHAYASGRGRVLVRARATFEEAANGRTLIVVTELPYQVNKAVLQERIAELIREKKIEGISAMQDESDRTGMRLVIEVKRDANPRKVLNLVRDELAELKKKYGDARRTEIVSDFAGEITDEDLVANEQVLITISGRGYVKRMPANTYRVQPRGGRGIIGQVLREEDALQHMIAANARDNILFFSDKGKVYQLKAWQVPKYDRTARGIPVINVINIEPGETITAILAAPDFENSDFLN